MSVGVEELRDALAGDEGGVRVEYDGGEVTAMVEHVEDEEPEYEKYGPGAPPNAGEGEWLEGRVCAQCYTPDPPEEWPSTFCRVRTRTSSGEWRDVRLEIAEATPERRTAWDARVLAVESVPSPSPTDAEGSSSSDGGSDGEG